MCHFVVFIENFPLNCIEYAQRERHALIQVFILYYTCTVQPVLTVHDDDAGVIVTIVVSHALRSTRDHTVPACSTCNNLCSPQSGSDMTHCYIATRQSHSLTRI